ncbi:hypothetical protein SCP_0802420 [Sparassis crispa]|uniref:Uncharacterized protein n=1 Tax=Sparassis crispa TaxID=139825 RepID=A0A401GU56_9APHY|nr:hypothetical protein SCP_0802420 [Sparassis crispa]GBE85720.1 hypothetical protein SCP_0802420 [Sparassis crispa]
MSVLPIPPQPSKLACTSLLDELSPGSVSCQHLAMDATEPQSSMLLECFMRTFLRTFFFEDFPLQTRALASLHDTHDGAMLQEWVLLFLETMVMGHA